MTECNDRKHEKYTTAKYHDAARVVQVPTLRSPDSSLTPAALFFLRVLKKEVHRFHLEYILPEVGTLFFFARRCISLQEVEIALRV